MMTSSEIFFGKAAPTLGDYLPAAYDDVEIDPEIAEMTQEECDAAMVAGAVYFDKMEKFVSHHRLWNQDWEMNPYWWAIWTAEWA